MLQSNTGKLFPNGIGHTNEVSSVLYSNVSKLSSEIKTDAGDLCLTINQDFPFALTYNFIERFEKSVPQEVESPNTNELLEEFSMLATVGLHAIFSPDREVVRILTDNQAYSYQLQDKLVRGIFDNRVNINDEEKFKFSELVESFLNLEPEEYEKAMRAIKRYYIAIQHIPIRPTLAYTMLVSSIDVLISANTNVKETDSKEEQPKFQSRANYKNYLIEHIDIEDLTKDTGIMDYPIREKELPIMLHNAYTIRSRYIHMSELLKEKLKTPFNFRNVREIDGSFYFTMQGLVRITHQSIINFIKNGKKIDFEKFKIEKEESENVNSAAELHLSNNKKLEMHILKQQFNGLLKQFAENFLGADNTVFIDLRPVLNEIENSMDYANEPEQVTMFAIHTFYNYSVDDEQKSKNHTEFFQKFKHILARAYPENLIIRTMIRNHDWTLDTHELADRQYWRQRYKSNQISGGPFFEAAISLDLAERHRMNGNLNLAREKIGEAVDYFPNHHKLRQFMKQYDGKEPIIWSEILEITNKSVDSEK